MNYRIDIVIDGVLTPGENEEMSLDLANGVFDTIVDVNPDEAILYDGNNKELRHYIKAKPISLWRILYDFLFH